MKFIERDNYHATSECGRYAINRANLLGGGAYQAVRLGKPWHTGPNGQPQGWDGSTILATERYEDGDDASRVSAYQKCAQACEADGCGD